MTTQLDRFLKPLWLAIEKTAPGRPFLASVYRIVIRDQLRLSPYQRNQISRANELIQRWENGMLPLAIMQQMNDIAGSVRPSRRQAARPPRTVG